MLHTSCSVGGLLSISSPPFFVFKNNQHLWSSEADCLRFCQHAKQHNKVEEVVSTGCSPLANVTAPSYKLSGPPHCSSTPSSCPSAHATERRSTADLPTIIPYLPMYKMHRRPQKWSQLFVLLVTVSYLGVDGTAVQNDFSDYPPGAQQCLYDASDNSGCDGDTAPEMNECLCGDGGDFVTNAAKCVAEKDSGDMESTYSTMSLHCSDSNTPLIVSKQEWMAEESDVSTSTSSTTIASKTSTIKTASKSIIITASTGQTVSVTSTGPPSSTSAPYPDNNTGLSTGAKVGIIVGSAAGGLALLAAALFFLNRRRRRRNHAYEDVHHKGRQSPSNPMGKVSTMLGLKRSGAANSDHTTTLPSVMGNSIDPRKSWQLSPDGRHIPWSPGAFEAVKLHPERGNLHQQPPDVYEMSTDSERPVSVAPPFAPVEMPVISVTSPTVSPTSLYPGTDWSSPMHETQSRYEPYRPSR